MLISFHSRVKFFFEIVKIEFSNSLNSLNGPVGHKMPVISLLSGPGNKIQKATGFDYISDICAKICFLNISKSKHAQPRILSATFITTISQLLQKVPTSTATSQKEKSKSKCNSGLQGQTTTSYRRNICVLGRPFACWWKKTSKSWGKLCN